MSNRKKFSLFVLTPVVLVLVLVETLGRDADESGSVALAVALYLLPTFIAWTIEHPKTRVIAYVNVFLGWTGVGWLLALLLTMGLQLKSRPARGGFQAQVVRDNDPVGLYGAQLTRDNIRNATSEEQPSRGDQGTSCPNCSRLAVAPWTPACSQFCRDRLTALEAAAPRVCPNCNRPSEDPFVPACSEFCLRRIRELKHLHDYLQRLPQQARSQQVVASITALAGIAQAAVLFHVGGKIADAGEAMMETGKNLFEAADVGGSVSDVGDSVADLIP